MKLRKRMEAGLSAPKSKSSAADLKQYQAALAQKISAERSQAKPEISSLQPSAGFLIKLIATPFESGDGSKIRASLRHAEPSVDCHPQSTSSILKRWRCNPHLRRSCRICQNSPQKSSIAS